MEVKKKKKCVLRSPFYLASHSSYFWKICSPRHHAWAPISACCLGPGDYRPAASWPPTWWSDPVWQTVLLPVSQFLLLTVACPWIPPAVSRLPVGFSAVTLLYLALISHHSMSEWQWTLFALIHKSVFAGMTFYLLCWSQDNRIAHPGPFPDLPLTVAVSPLTLVPSKLMSSGLCTKLQSQLKHTLQ